MPKPIIEVENISKLYHLGKIGATSLRESAEHWWCRMRGKTIPQRKVHKKSRVIATDDPQAGPEPNSIWSLKDVSFSVQEGEIVGIIGKNGAGKSTLLKILSRITEPTSGRAVMRGRVASLLEVGTGFHPELTGRENIYLNGAILGMRKREIGRKFDEIVAFSEVEKFIDTPVKHYSSGMHVRLGFAVAAHLDPEILIVDEVLAVGDSTFQKKCLAKMHDVSKQGKTILFVSHNINAINELCSRAILLDTGRVKINDTVSMAMREYFSGPHSRARIKLNTLSHKGPQLFTRLECLTLLDKNRQPATTFLMNDPLIAQIDLECHKAIACVEVGLKICSRYGTAIHYLTSTWEGLRKDLQPGKYCFEVKMPHILLYPGQYQVGLWVLREGEWSDDNIQEVTCFEVIKNDMGNKTSIEKYAFSGCEVYSPSEWKIVFRSEREAM